MRISTSQIYNIATLGISQAQTALVKTQEQLSTGKRVLSPADDPVAATAILQLNQELARTEQYKKNVDVADNSLDLEETNLQTIVDLVQKMRVIAVSAGNTAVMTKENYLSLAAEVDTRIEELVNLQNTRNASGQYIFAGYQSDTKPFESDGGGNYSYRGDEGQLRLQASASVSVAVSDSGKRLFVDIPSGHNTFTTSANPTNQAVPPAAISVGQVVDQQAFDKLYPNDLVVTFTKSGAATNFTVSERASGKQLLVNQPYMAGEDINVAGARFKILGNPYPGESAIAGAIPFDVAVPAGAINPGDTLRVTVGGKTEEFTFPGGVAAGDTAGFVAALNTGAAVPPTLPTGNAAKLANLGIGVDTAGFSSPLGLNITLTDGLGTSAVAMMGANGTRSVNMPFPVAPAAITPHDFSAVPASFQLQVNGKTETLTFAQNITNQAQLTAAFNDPANAAQLARLGVSVTDKGIIANNNSTITVSGGNTFLDGVMGFATQGEGSKSSRGVLVKPGDSFFIESSDKQALLTTLSRFSEAMKSVVDTPESKEELGKLVAKTLTNLTNVVTNLVAVQGEVGARLNTLESSASLNLDTILFTQTTLSNLESLDVAEASIRLSMQTLILNASQQSFAQVSQLSLFTYL